MPKTKPKPLSIRKETKLQIRLRPSEKQLIARAAKIRNTTVSGFLLDHARSAAEQVLAERVEFVLPPQRWDAFCKALDAPPRSLPALRKLLAESSVFDAGHAAR